MFRSQLFAVLTLVLLLPSAAVAQIPTVVVEVEGGPAWQISNDVEIPNDGTATRFSLVDLTEYGPLQAGRFYVTWNVTRRHGVRLLLAPFTLTGTGVPDRELSFGGEDYAAGTETAATYRFNSYRLSYRYRFFRSDRTSAWVGVTAMIRDAQVALEQGSTSSRKEDLGFVPLLHLSGEWRFVPGWRLHFDADALAGGPGRAIDAALKLGYDLDDRMAIQGGYRTVEGGADVEDVYNFAWLHYAVLSLTWRL